MKQVVIENPILNSSFEKPKTSKIAVKVINHY